MRIGLRSRSSVDILLNVASVFLVELVLASRVYAQGPSPGMEAWDRAGCWNCHGSDGYTNLSRAGRPSIAKTHLSLRRFLGQVRLPIWQMPPHSSQWVSDADLALIYDWLGGSEAVSGPPAVSVDLHSLRGSKSDGQAEAGVDIEVTVVRAQTGVTANVRDLPVMTYRVTLIDNSNVPLSRTLAYQQGGAKDWSEFTLNEAGEALLGRDRHFIATDEKDPGRGRARLRLSSPNARTVMLIEAIDDAQSTGPLVVGAGTAVLKGAAAPSRSISSEPARRQD